MITVLLTPDNTTLQFPKLNTVLQLMNRLNLLPNQALIIRNNELLTPDVKLRPGDVLEVRMVGSRG